MKISEIFIDSNFFTLIGDSKYYLNQVST